MSLLKKKRGQTAASAVVATVLLVVIAAVLVDGLNLLSTRQRCLEIATAAALKGASRGRDFSAYVSTGQIALNMSTAIAETTAALNDGLTALGLAGYTAQVEVLPNAGGGSIGNFPPGQTWTATEPSVGVYLTVPVDTFFMSWINGGGPVEIHVFAAAGVVES